MDSVVKARMLQGSTASLLPKIALARDFNVVPATHIKVDHKGTRQAHVSGNKVTILSMSAGAVSSWCKQRNRTIQMLRAIRKYAPHLIVVDESHLIKSHNSNVSKAMYQIGQLAPHRIILTGTVSPHSPLDVYGQWRFMAPWTFSEQHGEPYTLDPSHMSRAEVASIRPWPYGRFEKRYAIMGGFGGKNVVDMNPDSIGELHARVAERSQVVLKKDALDLPPTTDTLVHVSLNPAESRAYREMRDDLAAQMADGSLLEAKNALAKMMKLRQATAGFMKDTDTGQVHIIGDSKRKAMLEIATTQLVGENRIVLFGYFTSECRLLAETLRKMRDEKDTCVEMITGATKARDRLAIRQTFGDVSRNAPKRMILVAQARTMSLSVNELVTAQHAIYGTLSERRDDLVQSRGRLDRQGQKLPVTFWNTQVPGSVDEVMFNNHMNRGNLEKAMLDHIRVTAGKPVG
jgi:hypothetical protein